VSLALIRVMSGVGLALVFCAAGARAESGLERAGDITQVVIPVAAGLSTAVAADLEGTGQLSMSFLGTLGITYALKYTVDRDRPEGHGAHSFPSGHTAVAFQGATFVGRRYGWLCGAPFCLAAAFVGWSRIEAESDKHDEIDILAGAAIGSLISYCLTTRYQRVVVVPTVGNGTYGLSISARW
jgi:membrane-associated phospholipid phosphatase